MKNLIIFEDKNGATLCVDHLPAQYRMSYEANPKARTIQGSYTNYRRISKAEALEFGCEYCNREQEAQKKAPVKPASAHANCSHEKTPAARAKCRREANKK